ncbi:MAG: oxidoreductase, partial [Acidimicrobiia bacterium]
MPDDDPTAPVTRDDEMVDQVRAATELLEAVACDPAVLEALSEPDRIRLRAAAGNVFAPDVEVRRQLVRARQRRERAQKIRRDEAAREQTGIRTLRAKPVFSTPNVFPPDDFAQEN